MWLGETENQTSPTAAGSHMEGELCCIRKEETSMKNALKAAFSRCQGLLEGHKKIKQKNKEGVVS